MICTRAAPTEARTSILLPNSMRSRRVISMAVSLEVRIVRLVAPIAQHAARMFGGGDLREAFGLGGILLVAAAAKRRDVGQFGLGGGWVVGIGVGGLRSVARFARNMRVT